MTTFACPTEGKLVLRTKNGNIITEKKFAQGDTITIETDGVTFTPVWDWSQEDEQERHLPP